MDWSTPLRLGRVIFLLFGVTLLFRTSHLEYTCKDPGSCNRTECNDTFAIPPKKCHDHIDEMGCFRVCKDPAELLECYSERAGNGTIGFGQEYCALKYSRNLLTVHPPSAPAAPGGSPPVLFGQHTTTHIGIPCSVKCQVDPIFWGCVHRCDDKGCFNAFENCTTVEANVTVNGVNVTRIPCNTSTHHYMLEEQCRDCFVQRLITEVEVHPECIFRYTTTSGSSSTANNATDAKEQSRRDQLSQCTHISGLSQGKPDVINDTGAWEDVNFCITDLIQMNREPNTEDMEKCYRNVLMQRQIELCHNAEYTPQCTKKNLRECQDRCLIALTKPYCYLPCRRNIGLQACRDNCLIEWPVIRCSCDNRTGNNFAKFMLDPTARYVEFEKRASACPALLWPAPPQQPQSYGPMPDCIINAIHDEVRPLLFGSPVDEWEKDVVRLRNCKSKRHIIEFANRLVADKGRPGFFHESMGKLAHHYTYLECALTDCRKQPLFEVRHCVKSCLAKVRTEDEINMICNGSVNINHPESPLYTIKGTHNFLRAEIALVCLFDLLVNKTAGDFGFSEYLTVPGNPGDNSLFNQILSCEVFPRFNVALFEPHIGRLKRLALITYEVEMDWCQNCIQTQGVPGAYHPDEFYNANCELRECYLKDLERSCPPVKSTDTLVKAAVSTLCYWQMDFSLSPEPYTIWATYFDEIPPHDQSHNMVQPNTLKYLMKSSIGASRGHYIFPYFLVIRPFCETGYYDDNVYKFIASGGTPTVQIVYYPSTSRQKYVDLMRANFQGALVNLQRVSVSDKLYIPANPLNRGNLTADGNLNGTTGCHLNLCYPAFLVPQVLLHIPIFQVVVNNQQTINSAHMFGYTATLHLRDESGRGSLKIADKLDPPTADEYFPVRKVQVYEDTQFVHLWSRLPDSGYQAGSGVGIPGPELEHVKDHNCQIYQYPNKDNISASSGPFHPLDTEDFFQLQLTHGNAPQAIFAGFYDPNLVIIGDPDMRRYELVRWQFEVTGGSPDRPSPHLFHEGYPCFSHNFKVRGFVKPMYSLFDRLDPDYWIEYYRMRYVPKDYKSVKTAKAIFSAITLEDRILFVTTSGIVTFYQNFNLTAGLGKAWEVEPGDRLKKCFKIVRVAKRAHPKGDTIVAITYDYQVSETQRDEHGNIKYTSKGNRDYLVSDVSQQVWVGTYLGRAEPIKWQEITSGLTSENLKEERVFNVGGDKVGDTGFLPLQKLMHTPVERRETNPKSQIEAICYKTYRSNMGKARNIELIEDQGWCDAVDATPVVAVDQKIQVLVRMKVYYSGGTKSHGNPKPRVVILYVVASFSTDKSASQSSIWQIDAIIPRIPCQDEHRESIPSVVQYNTKYFKSGHPDTIKSDYGCHSKESNAREENKIFLHGMTYTRSYNHHLFLYGNKLLQSTDGGQTFVMLKSFPEMGSEYQCAADAQLSYHRIKVMAFDDLGHYAFLTSKRELWYGNLGSLTQIRLRPSKAFSMTSTRLYEVHEMTEAVPFTVFFDSSNELVEMVAVVDANGTVSKIARRSMNERTILRARTFMDELSKVEEARYAKLSAQKERLDLVGLLSDRVFDEQLLEKIYYTPLKWSVFCPYASPSFYHNFSERHGRAQNFFFPAPRQHLQLGNEFTTTSLYTYQAVAFNLVWNSFFNNPYRSYSFEETDPFKLWAKKKQDASVLGQLTYLNNDPNDHGILVTPEKYRRHAALESKRIFDTYYMDYGIIIRLVIEFSISNDYSLNKIDYLNHHLDDILLNVDNANGSLIQINTEKDVLASRAAIRYVIIISVRKYTGLPQSHSGRDGIKVPIKLHLIGGFGKCIPTANSAGIHGDSIATVIQVGCPPSLDLVFDWDSTLQSIKFRDIAAHYGKKSGDCYKGEKFCFFARYPLIPHFHIFDSSKQTHYNFSGQYIMRIIAGGYSRDSLNTYTAEEQQAFNIPGVSDVSLIWNEWDGILHQKVQRSSAYVTTTGRNDSREIVLRAGESAIQWGCHTLSPCARISPRKGLETVYYFKIFITNRGVDNDTLCLFEKEFIVLLYGFPPSPEIQLVTSVAFYMFILTILYIAYFCLRGHKKLWRSTTMKLYGWFQVIKDTLPKSWFKSGDEGEEETELEAQKRRDEIILSLQGHLNVPRLLSKDTAKEKVTEAHRPSTEAPEGDADEGEESQTKADAAEPTAEPSVTSINSGSSDEDNDSAKFVIDPLNTRPAATTWTDLIYEQIISKRLAAILERNRQKAEDLKAKGEADAARKSKAT